MSLDSIKFNIGAAKSDRKRDALIPFPTGVAQITDISYGPHRKHNLLDVYYPEGAQCCPVIINVHGGGYVYGDKELYKRYCMDLARRGFTVVNFNYRLAPRWKFPAPLEDLNNVMLWLNRESQNYHADITRIFMVGDSAGAQLTSQYAAMLSNPAYMTLFGFKRPDPDIGLRAVGLNCGMYDLESMASQERYGLFLDYLGRKLSNDDPRLAVLDHISLNYPPAHITTACHDFLRSAAQPMAAFLQEKGVEVQWTCYGTEEDSTIGHVFHINIIHPEAIACNDAQCAFFRKYL